MMKRFLLYVSASILIVGCSSNTSDLQDWIQSVKAKPAGPIQPMPEVKQPPSFEYSAAEFRSPFSNLAPEVETQLQAIAEGCDSSIRPDPDRRREDLERFSLDSMKMVGAMFKGDDNWGLIKMGGGPSAGKVFKVTTGNYLGVNHGKIVDINEFRIVVETLVPDGQGCWEKRTVNLALND